MAQDVLSISQVNEYIRAMMDGDRLLSSIAVRGEISNYKVYPSGHHYFSLKDGDSALKCVMFRGNASRLRFRPDNGIQVLAMGKISVYPRDGAYQLYCAALMPDGVGDLHTAFEQLKGKLSAQGLFDPVHKKQLPSYPKTIGIVTSPAGAAIHDMLQILNKRYPLCKVYLLPVRVQGAEAPEEIADAIDLANRICLTDILIVGRGGGSIEDLWAFNDERVAHAIYRSAIPVISAVGHEPDVTIADYVADLRAATPSNAAELAVPDQDTLRQTLDSILMTVTASLGKQLQTAHRQLSLLSKSPALRTPDIYLQQKQHALDLLCDKLVSCQKQNISQNKHFFATSAAKLDALSPLKILSRGYALVQAEEGSVLRSVTQTASGDTIKIKLRDGTVGANVTYVKESVYEQEESHL